MKGNCDLVKCQMCQQEMSFGRIKRHISSRHKDISVEKYIKQYWQTLPLHKPCEICSKNIVYKYQTCSKECQSIKASKERKGISKPEGFMSKEHKDKLSNSHKGKIVSKETGEKISKSSKGVSRNEGRNSPMLGKKQSDYQKQKVKERFLKYYKEGNRPWSELNPCSPNTIKKIFQKRKSNKLETFVSYILDKNNIKYDFQFFLSRNGICKSYDFKIKDSNILLEIDGDYWHGNPKLEKHFYKIDEVKQNDLFKNKFAEENGYKIIRLWESDIYNNPEIIINKLKEYSDI